MSLKQHFGRVSARGIAFLDQNKWRPLVVFMSLPTVFLVLCYLSTYLFRVYQPFIWFFVALCVLTLIWFIIFLKMRRPGELAAMAAILPNVVGPLLTEVYVKIQWPKALPPSPLNLRTALDNGGDTLIQMAFFFTSVFAIAVYVYRRMTKGEPVDKVSYVVFVFIIGAMGFMGKEFFLDDFVTGKDPLPHVTMFFAQDI